MKKQNKPYNDYMDIIKIAVRHIAKAESKVVQRCLIEGCRYGIGLPNEKPQDRCIYCGKESQSYDDAKYTSLLKKIKL